MASEIPSVARENSITIFPVTQLASIKLNTDRARASRNRPQQKQTSAETVPVDP
ncbi:MAG: hypothetical protein ACJATP_002090 [Candidatus Azotimanducaceae bacterium]|jgi:hypothetical protein